MTGRPATSIIIPAFDAGATIGRALESVIRQRRRDWEAIVVDDGSRDDTAAIVSAAAAAADPRIRLIRQANMGAAAARNRGLAEARGAWTLFLDADDTISPDHLRRMHRRAGPGVDAVACGHVRLSEDGRVVALYRPPALDRDAVAICARRPPAAIHAILTRTAMLRAAGGFDAGLRTNEDWDLWWRVARAGARFAIERRRLAQYRASPGSLTRDHAAMLRDTLTMLERTGGGADAALEALLWNGGMAIGGGGDPLALRRVFAGSPVGAGYSAVGREGASMAGVVGAIVEGLAIGTGRPIGGLASAWPQIAGGVAAFLAAIGQAEPGVGDAIARGVEQEVIRAARFRRAVTVGHTLGVMLSPRILLRGIAAQAGVRRVVVKVPLVRPRSWLLVPADLAEGLTGRALRRLLLGRLRR